jgi:hypothetical protein
MTAVQAAPAAAGGEEDLAGAGEEDGEVSHKIESLPRIPEDYESVPLRPSYSCDNEVALQ